MLTVDVPPLQSIGVDVEETTNWVGSLTVMVVTASQPMKSVTVNEYVPAGKVWLPEPV